MKTMLLLAVLSQAGDLGSTALALSRGCVEVNPLLRPHPIAFGLVVKSGALVGAAALKRRHRSMLGWGLVAQGAGATVWNLAQRCI